MDIKFLLVELEFELMKVLFVKGVDADFLRNDLEIIFLGKAQFHLL